MRQVMVFGTFDGIHPGHEFFLMKAREFGDHLTVVVALDETVSEAKGRSSNGNQDKRLEEIQSLPYVDRAVLGQSKDKYAVIEELKPQIICLGHDQHLFGDDLPGELLKRHLKCKVIRLPPYQRDKYSTTLLRKSL